MYIHGNLLANTRQVFCFLLEIWCQMHKWQKNTKLLLPQCLVFLQLYWILRMTQLCTDQGCIYTALNKRNFLTFSNAEVSFTLCVTHAAHSQSALIQQWFVQSWVTSWVETGWELRNFPIRFFLCWFVAHQGTGRRAVPWKFPAHRPCLLLLQFRASSTGSQKPNISVPL